MSKQHVNVVVDEDTKDSWVQHAQDLQVSLSHLIKAAVTAYIHSPREASGIPITVDEQYKPLHVPSTVRPIIIPRDCTAQDLLNASNMLKLFEVEED